MTDLSPAALIAQLREQPVSISWAKWVAPSVVISAELRDQAADLLSSLQARIEALEKEQCICAAVKLPNGEVWRGHRHNDALRVAGRAPDTSKDALRDAEQGFVTSLNRFVGREEGARIQRAAGIPSAATLQPVKDILCSEDLYLRDWREAVYGSLVGERP